MAASRQQTRLDRHVAQLLQCRRCPRMIPPPVSGGPIASDVILIGQAPGIREPVLNRPFAWTAGKTLFRWFEEFCGMNEAAVRSTIYFAAVCRCFPGKAPGGSDRVPAPDEIRNCSSWMDDEFEILQPRLAIPVGKLAIAQFIPFQKLDEVVGRKFRIERANADACRAVGPSRTGVSRRRVDLIPLPHPSGASPWHKLSPGKELLRRAFKLIAGHPAVRELKETNQESRKRGK